jgi:hypothetical protein
VAQHGKQSIGNIVRALVRDDVPDGLAGLELWRDVFQACGYNLAGVLDGFYERLDAELQEHREFVDAVPRLRAAVKSGVELITLKVEPAPTDKWKVVCRFRQDRDSPERSYLRGLPIGGDRYVVRRDNFPSATVWYQLGIYDENATVIYEPWTRIRLDD